MYMDLDDLIIRDGDDTVADGLKEQSQLIGVGVDLGISADDELGAIGKVDDLVEFSGSRTEEVLRGIVADSGGLFLIFYDDAVADNGKHTLEDRQDTLAACVDNACLFQNGQHLGRLLQRVCGSVTDDLPQHGGIVLCLKRFQTCLIAHAGNGQDGTLGRLGNSVVSRFYTQTQRMDDILAGSLDLALESLGDTAEQQRGDNTGVAACAAKHRGSGLLGDGSDVRSLKILQRIGSSDNGHRHIGTRIAVRYRENVEVIDARFDGKNIIGAGNNCLFESFTVYHG